ncbi:unnamed protein product [Mycena citricolor]|uniref:Myb-like domain-containing protein n=1 Tax=Mycena citricolor TaxID=2018698 RepID=A0AAD2HVN0_9AGAR|nr:unnamed protein product [Mycena citricolor]
MARKTQRWLPFQDQYLAQAVDERRPFLEPKQNLKEAWNETAAVLEKNSRAEGPQSAVVCTGSACRTRFNKIMGHHKVEQRDETRSLQKTGAVEDISKHLKLMTELRALLNDEARVPTAPKTFKAKKKADLERQAGLEMRDAAMMGLVDTSTLTDVTQLEGSSVCEKQGQQKRNRDPLGDTTNQNEDEQTETSVRPKKRRRGANAMNDALAKKGETLDKTFEDARKQGANQHAQIIEGQERIVESQDKVAVALNELLGEIKGMRQDAQGARDTNGLSRVTEILAQALVDKK